MRYNEKGEELPDPTPVRVTPKVRITPNKLAEFQAMLRTASYLARNEGYETLEESEDFDVGDDFDPGTPWELQFDKISGREITRQEAEYLEQQRSAFDKQFGKQPPWWRRMLRKKTPQKAPEPIKKDSKEPPVDSQQEQEDS